MTGNYLVDTEVDSSDDDDEDDEDYGMGLEDYDTDSEVDELDDLRDPRITEVDTDEEEAPKLVAQAKKGKNKRPAEDESLDDLMAKAEEAKLSKKQQKKLKNNKGEPVKTEPAKDAAAKGDKKVQFAKNLEQGPTGSGATEKGAATLGVKVVSGVTVDDRKVGSGRAAKKGNKVEVRYIGKLENGKVFDCKSRYHMTCLSRS